MEVSGKIKDYGDETSDKVCELCQTDKQAAGFCKDCEQFMCNACFRLHLRAKVATNHVMVNVDQSPRSSTPGRSSERAVKCKQHGGEIIKFYCRKHEVVGCGDCVVQNHNVCKAEFIDKLAKDFHQNYEFKALMSKIEQIVYVNNKNSEKILENERNNTMLLEKALGDIRQYRTDINQYLDKVEADVISEAKAVMSDNKKLLAKLKKDCELLSTKIEKINQALNVKCFQNNELFINTVENKPTVSEIETEIADVQSKCLKEFNFVPDEQLKNIVISKKRLGRLITTAVVLTPKDKQKTVEKTKDVDKKKTETHNFTYSSERMLEKVVHGTMSAGAVKVGSRVRPRGYEDWSTWTYSYGTVTAVHTDETVTVKWDNGYESRPNIKNLTIIG